MLSTEELVCHYKNGATTHDLAKRFRVTQAAVWKRLRSAGIVMRPPGRPNTTIIPQDEAADIYRQGATLDDLAMRYGMPRSTLAARMRQAGTRLRAPGPPGKEVQLSEHARAVLNGELLGDGSLRGRHGGPSARYRHTCKHREYVEWLSGQLARCGIHQGGKIREFMFADGRTAYHYATLSYRGDLRTFCDAWYPDGVKRVPVDLDISPTACLHWYLGDGSLLRSWGGRSRYVRFATCGFTEHEVSLLCDKFRAIGMDARIQKDRSYWLIRLTVSGTRDFFDYIGPCPVACYQYKWPQDGPDAR